MCGNVTPATDQPGPWFDLVDLSTDRVVGQINRRGEVRHADPEIALRIATAFERELTVRDDAIADDLGVCFADIDTVSPQDDAHDDLVFRNLGLLTGLIPRSPLEPGSSRGS